MHENSYGFREEMAMREIAQMAHLQRKRRITLTWHGKCISFQPRPEPVVKMKTLLKDMKIAIHRPHSLLTLAILLVNATLVLGGQLDPTTQAGQCGDPLNESVNELPAPHFDGPIETFAPTVKKVSPAVVRVVIALRSDGVASPTSGIENPLSRYSFGKVPPRLRSVRLMKGGLGSGVIVTEDGYILTNSHLVAGANEVEVTLQDGREFKARVIGLDAQSDIAVVKIDAHHLPTVPLADSRKVQVGDLVLAIGNPFGVGQTVTHGIVSATDRGGMGIEDYESFIQTDAPINPGNSGGALVDVTGRLIGINTAILSSSGGNLGIGFAVPSDVARRVMTDLVKYGYVVRGYLGVETQNLTPSSPKSSTSRCHRCAGGRCVAERTCREGRAQGRRCDFAVRRQGGA